VVKPFSIETHPDPPFTGREKYAFEIPPDKGVRGFVIMQGVCEARESSLAWTGIGGSGLVIRTENNFDKETTSAIDFSICKDIIRMKKYVFRFFTIIMTDTIMTPDTQKQIPIHCFLHRSHRMHTARISP
jgi:hypothetical protein